MSHVENQAHKQKFLNQPSRTGRIFAVSLVHFSIGISIVAVGTYIPAQLASAPYFWSTTAIAFLLGTAILFETFRLVIGYFGDRRSILGSYRRNYVFLGLIVESLGLILISQLIGSILIIVGMILFAIGSATVATISDVYLIDISDASKRSRVGAILQMSRLGGFAAGGIMGLILFERLDFTNFFIFLALFSFIVSLRCNSIF